MANARDEDIRLPPSDDEEEEEYVSSDDESDDPEPSIHESDDDDEETAPKYPRIVKFQYSGSTVSATAEQPYVRHKNVLRLTIHRSTWLLILISLLAKLPAFARALAAKIRPAWFLPRTFVLKQYKRGWKKEFNNEKRMYTRLEALQGRLIPEFYGEVEFEGVRALIISEIRGVQVLEQAQDRLSRDEFISLLLPSLRELADHGVYQGDKKLHNLILVENRSRLVFIDLERMYEGSPEYFAKAFAMIGAKFCLAVCDWQASYDAFLSSSTLYST